jgi:glycosyltransferase involved in cell wall biosynthesis
VPDLAPDCAVAVRPGDPVQLADAIVNLLTDADRLAHMRQRVRQRIIEEYDAPVAGDKFLTIYDEAIERSRR